ncbi:MAG: NUDIX domain-containing protein [Candidatus Absconditabacteria bacterium]
MNKVQLSGCAIIKDGKLLLLFKKKHQHYEFPGGKLEIGETLEQCAIREAKEEIGCDVKIIKYIGFKEFEINNKSYQSHKYLATIIDNQQPIVNEPKSFENLCWVDIQNYHNYNVAENVKAFCDDFICGKLKTN